MGNMPYCRFRTLKDLKKCLETLEGYDEDITSEREREACIEMIESIVAFLDRKSLLELTENDGEGSNYELNKERLEEMMGPEEN